MWPTATAPCGRPLAAHPGGTTARAAPVSSIQSAPSASRPLVRMFDHPSEAATSVHALPFGARLFARTRAEAQAERHPQVAQEQEIDRAHPLPGGSSATSPTCSRPCGRDRPGSHRRRRPLRCCHRGVPSTSPRCSGRRHRVAPGSGVGRAYAISNPFGGCQPLIKAEARGEGGQRGSCCRGRTTSWSGWSGKTIATRLACVVGRCVGVHARVVRVDRPESVVVRRVRRESRGSIVFPSPCGGGRPRVPRAED